MDDQTIAEIAGTVRAKGAKRALLAMTELPQFPGRGTFDPNGAWSLYRSHPSLCDRTNRLDGKYMRAAYWLTSTGLAVRAYLKDQGNE